MLIENKNINNVFTPTEKRQSSRTRSKEPKSFANDDVFSIFKNELVIRSV